MVIAQNDEAFVDSLVAQKMAELEMQDNPEYFDSKHQNVNAKYNQSLQLIKLDNEVSKILQNLEEAGRFLREN